MTVLAAGVCSPRGTARKTVCRNSSALRNQVLYRSQHQRLFLPQPPPSPPTTIWNSPWVTIAYIIQTNNGSWCIGMKGEMSHTVCVTLTWYSNRSPVLHSEAIMDVKQTSHPRKTPWWSVTKIPLITQDANRQKLKRSSTCKHQQIRWINNYRWINHNPITYMTKIT